VPRSIIGWFVVCWSAFLLASAVVGVLLLSLYRQTTTEQVRRASAAVAHGCDAIAGRYQFLVAGTNSPPSDLRASELVRGLTGAVQIALRDLPGVEGGIWQTEQGSLAYAFPTYEGTGEKTDLPSAEEPQIRDVADASALDGVPVDRHRDTQSQVLLLHACPLTGPIPHLSAWTMARVISTGGRSYIEAMAGLGVLLLVVLGSAAWLGRLLLGWTRRLRRLEVELGTGTDELPRLDLTGQRDLDRIIDAVNRAGGRLADARREADALARQVAESQRLAMDAAQLGWWQYDPLHRVVSGDRRFKEIFDVTADETPIEDIKKRVHPDDRERFWAARETALDPVDPKPYAREYRIKRGDGEVRWLETHGLANFDGAGRERRVVSLIGTVADITERKQREEQVHLLMREVNQRAKNMLSVVDSIAHQTATRNPEDFIERFSERIQALSANQDLLVRSDWSGVDIEDLVCAQLAHFTGLIGSRIAVHGPKLRLKAASAQAIGLALHELATNAGKYGALSTDTGYVDVCWGADGDTLAMSWTEREGPPVSPPKRRGFGTIVMEAMAERSVDGTVDLGYAPSGVTWRLTCPAANALEPWERGPNFSSKRKSN
jgi:PAS domain S-box-containing protein